MRANVQQNGKSRRMLVGIAILMAFLVLSSAPAYAKSSNGHGTNKVNQNKQHMKYDPTLLQMSIAACDVSGSVATCQGGRNSSSTFVNATKAGDVVTVTMSYLTYDSGSPVLSFSDSLGNSAVLVTQQCPATTPVICTAVGYFLVTNPGEDVITVTVTGGAIGCIRFTAEEWFADYSTTLVPLGTNGSCSACTGSLSLTPITFTTAPSEVIAVSQVTAIFSTEPSSWTMGSTWGMATYDGASGSGYEFAFGGSDTLALSYDFNCTVTGAVPTAFAGSGLVLYI